MLFALWLATTQLSCDYIFQGVPFAGVQLSVFDNGMPESSALVHSGGPGTPAHKESVTPAALGPGEYLHVWISKEQPANAIEMIVYDPPRAEGQSVLINDQVPFGKEVWGACTGVPGR